MRLVISEKSMESSLTLMILPAKSNRIWNLFSDIIIKKLRAHVV